MHPKQSGNLFLCSFGDVTDPYIFENFRQGDPAAAEWIFLSYVKPLALFVGRLTGSRPEAEDIVADTFIKLLERRAEFADLDNVRAFLYRTARNAAIDLFRATGRHRAAHGQLSYLSQAGGEHLEEAIDQQQVRAEVLAAIYAEIEELPGRCREIFKLLFIHGQTHEEVAGRMGINVQTVRSQKSRALELLRTALLKKGHLSAVIYLLEMLAQHGL